MGDVVKVENDVKVVQNIKDLFEVAFISGKLHFQVDVLGLARVLASKTDNKLDDTGVDIADNLLKDVKISTKGFILSYK